MMRSLKINSDKDLDKVVRKLIKKYYTVKNHSENEEKRNTGNKR